MREKKYDKIRNTSKVAGDSESSRHFMSSSTQAENFSSTVIVVYTKDQPLLVSLRMLTSEIHFPGWYMTSSWITARPKIHYVTLFARTCGSAGAPEIEKPLDEISDRSMHPRSVIRQDLASRCAWCTSLAQLFALMPLDTTPAAALLNKWIKRSCWGRACIGIKSSI